MTLYQKFINLKTAIGGNREKQGFEHTFGMPKEEELHITRMSKWNHRLVSELEFALHLCEAQEGLFEEELNSVLDYLLECQKTQGVLTDQVCEQAETMLPKLQKAAKEYDVILAAHAHIDMNWMWSFTETVSIVLNTFRSILNIMNEYPDFCFSQSQASVYKIVEEYDPELMEEIKARIAEGRWEVTATAWVETDKNMPTGESLLRHIKCTREYLEETWGVKNFELDFSPDTFGHSRNIPEINQFGTVNYMYHCRGNARKDVLYRFRAPSKKEVIAYCEPNWYNAAITPQIGAGLLEIVKKSSGLKTALMVYGVGDHGGGPTRRDVERALEMMEWKIYPNLRFGTMLEYFKVAETIRENLPVVEEELNYFAPGCYTTQSRIKRGNRRCEAALLDAESLTALANIKAGMPLATEKVNKAWQDVLFTHFHDILTGSCVQDTREHAMGLFQTSMATANTQLQIAMKKIAENIDTSFIPVEIDGYNSQSEGAGVGYGIDNFVGVPSTERGSGKTRILHIFNTQAVERTEQITVTVWDWVGDLRRLQMIDYKGNEIPFQLLDSKLQTYWDHKYIRILLSVTVPAMGYTTVVVKEKEAVEYKAYLHEDERVSSVYDDYVLENDQLKVVISSKTGRIQSYYDKENGEELLAKGSTGGLLYQETECMTSNAWNIGRVIKEVEVDQCIQLQKTENGPLRSSVEAEYRFEHSKATVTYRLEQGKPYVEVSMKIDWNEAGGTTNPVLTYQIPLHYNTTKFQYDVPCGVISREARNNDVPALQYAVACNPSGSSLTLMSDSKYGYRGEEKAISLTLINNSTYPDPYPERGIQEGKVWIGLANGSVKDVQQMATNCNHGFLYQSGNRRKGSLPMEGNFFTTTSNSTVISSVSAEEGNTIVIRGYELEGNVDPIQIKFDKAYTVETVNATNLMGEIIKEKISIHENEIQLTIKPYSLFELKCEIHSNME